MALRLPAGDDEVLAGEGQGAVVVFLVAANVFFLLFDDPGELERARRGVRERLENSH